MARSIRWLLGILAALALLAGFLILFGGDDQSLGFWGDASWRIGDIDPVWGYGLIGGGAAVLLAVLAAAVQQRRTGRT